MPRKAEAGGGFNGPKPWLDTESWLELAKHEAVVLIRRVERVEDYESELSKERAEQYSIEVIVAHSKKGARTGEYYPPFKITSRAIISKFGDPIESDEEGKGGRRGAVDGEVIGARIVSVGKSKLYPGANEPSGLEWEAVEKFYAANDATFDEAGDEKLFATFAARYADERRSNVRDQTSKLAGKGRPAAADDDDDDEPPF